MHLSGSEASAVRTRVLRIAKHPAYDADTADFDVAVLELARPLPFGRYVQPACLPAATHVFPPRKKCLISGWGYLKEDFRKPTSILPPDCHPSSPEIGACVPAVAAPVSEPMSWGLRQGDQPSKTSFSVVRVEPRLEFPVMAGGVVRVEYI